MARLVRTSLSLDEDLCKRMDALVRMSDASNRSKFVCDLLRQELVRQEWRTDRETVATVTLVYDHHVHDLQHRLTHIQHHHAGNIIASLHIHLSEERCLEVIVARGRGSAIKKLAQALRGLKGVLHGDVTVSSTGKDL
jgi:CopG family transcriptional regulator, nickel-responsive regulator